MPTVKATFAAGCFWGVEDAFLKVEGVTDVVSGYTGGQERNPTYELVCSNATGHAEAVEVTYDPAKVAYEKLLETFWDIHDPTQIDRQGPDVGKQYRSVIFVHDEEQRKTAEASKAALSSSGRFKKPIATAIVDASEFYRAEEYHQRYHQKHKRLSLADRLLGRA